MIFGLFGLFGILGLLLLLGIIQHRRRWFRIQSHYDITIDAGQESFYLVSELPKTRKAAVDFEIRDCNARGAALLGQSRSQLIGKKLSSLCKDNPAGHVLGICTNVYETGTFQDQFFLTADTRVASGWVQRRVVRAGSMMAVTLHDISESKVHEEELTQIANLDTLTLLANRHWLMTFLPAAISRAHAKGVSLAILLIDIDDFKNINDVLGHDTGDELLCAVASRLNTLCGPHDSLARLGGDEFTMVLEQLQDVAEAEQKAQHIVDAFERAFNFNSDYGRVRVSIGISVYPAHADDARALMKFADLAMYAAKMCGKARYCLYEPHLSERLNSRINARKALEEAVENHQFLLYYQPRINAQTGIFCSMEALIRWAHPSRGLVLPHEFIPLAEECGLIAQIGAMVIDQTCAQLARWHAQKLPCVPISVNVSLKQFDHTDVTALIRDTLHKYHLPASLIEVELTESCMMSSHIDIASHLAGLHALGVKLLVDDFGTGYSSLSQLQQLDLDVLKVDRAFAKELDGNAEGAVFFKAIISMAHALNMTVVAEGIETETQLRTLQNLGCNEIQGFLIAPPLPAADIPALLLKKVWSPFFQPVDAMNV